MTDFEENLVEVIEDGIEQEAAIKCQAVLDEWADANPMSAACLDAIAQYQTDVKEPYSNEHMDLSPAIISLMLDHGIFNSRFAEEGDIGDDQHVEPWAIAHAFRLSALTNPEKFKAREYQLVIQMLNSKLTQEKFHLDALMSTPCGFID